MGRADPARRAKFPQHRAAPAARVHPGNGAAIDRGRGPWRRFRCVTMDSLYSKSHIRESLNPRPSTPEEDMQWLAGASPDVVSRGRDLLPARRGAAGGLAPLV